MFAYRLSGHLCSYKDAAVNKPEQNIKMGTQVWTKAFPNITESSVFASATDPIPITVNKSIINTIQPAVFFILFPL